MFPFSLLAPLLSVCMLLSARAAVMLPYNVERVPVQREREALSAEHLHEFRHRSGRRYFLFNAHGRRHFYASSNTVRIPIRR